MKSKTNAIATIATTYGITRGDASRVLERDALHGLRDTHAAINCAFERVVHLFPLHDVERVGIGGEQLADRRVVDRIALLLESLDLQGALADDLLLAQRSNARLDVLCRLDEHAGKLLRGLFDLGDVQHLEATGRAIEQV